MEKLKRSLSFRKKKDHVPECSKPHQWQEDERKVREGTCSFQVRYLGCIEVFESRGLQVCEEAVKALKAKLHRSVWARMSLRKKKRSDKESDGVDTDAELAQAKGKYQRAILYVSGDALRVVDEISKGLIVDQTIEKVSFCAPDRNHEKGFAYICRDGTTRRWMCHGFLALKESGERLSHAVGCAFAICLEKKQKREKEAVSVQFNDKGTSFARTGSFRQATLTERLADPQSVIAAEPVPMKVIDNIGAVERPHASMQMLERQGSFRGFQKLSESSPFKRQLSLRVNELPSTLERQKNAYSNGINNINGPAGKTPVMQSSIPEVSPTKENPPDSISEMCQQLTQGLSALTTQSPDPFASAPGGQSTTTAAVHSTTPPCAPPVAAPQTQPPSTGTGYTATAQGRNIPLPEPIRQTNPWASPPPTTGGSKISDAEFWLSSTAKAVSATPPPTAQRPTINGASPTLLGGGDGQMMVTPPQIPISQNTPQSAIAHRAPHLSHLRSHSIDSSDMWSASPQRPPTLRELQQKGHPMAQFQSQQNGTTASPPVQNISASPAGWTTFNNPAPVEPKVDPFDAAWAAKAPTTSQATNPFQGGNQKAVTKEFTVNL